MRKLLVLALIGLAAQLVDGSLGMAYGVTSTSLLLAYGIAPAVASASVHIAELVTTAASGYSHWRFGNVDKSIVRGLILPGSIGAFGGACFLSSLSSSAVRPYIAAFLFLLGLYVFVRFLFIRPQKNTQKAKSPRRRFLIPLGVIAGFADATGGGGWGPLTTPTLLARKGAQPRTVVGSVDTSEFAIALAASLGFLISLGWSQVSWTWVIALMAGGVIAAPIAAWLVKIIPASLLGVLVGGLILVTNAKTLMSSFDLTTPIGEGIVYTGLIAMWAVGITFILWKLLRERNSGAGGNEAVSMHKKSDQ
ncbi:sulfite exporter TauE/SafE family protein [Marininema halotolerans]|uniref:Probable membrane transporter protein n=1 Tax=Marininema halotolerans TaxID=1155944 RepID=A0A1I6RDM7_9BACL|nr:sulfite exporter TauE/SafE family protein [Marininema halotolerans]SFS62766.1 hypothetical protein SAMN05444972_10518 [Marininema halotolerans]